MTDDARPAERISYTPPADRPDIASAPRPEKDLVARCVREHGTMLTSASIPSDRVARLVQSCEKAGHPPDACAPGQWISREAALCLAAARGVTVEGIRGSLFVFPGPVPEVDPVIWTFSPHFACEEKLGLEVGALTGWMGIKTVLDACD